MFLELSGFGQMLPEKLRDLFQLKATLDDLYSIEIELPSVF